MNTTATHEWKFTSFSSYLKTFLTRDLPIAVVFGSALLVGNYLAQNGMNPTSYSKLASGFENGLNYLAFAYLVFLTLLSTAGLGASLYAGVNKRQPMARCILMGTMSLAVILACEWALVHMLRGDLGEIIGRTAVLFGA